MAVSKLKPTSPGRRFAVVVKTPDIHKGKPYKPLLKGKKRSGGRNNRGRITTRHRGGGHRQSYRLIDFRRSDKDGVKAIVERIEYDPIRSARIALLLYTDGSRRYIVAPAGLTAGSNVEAGPNAPIKPGNCLPLAKIPVGVTVHCVELRPGAGAALARSAGTAIQYVAREGKYAILRLRSQEMRRVLLTCRATLGAVGNQEHNLRSLGKAGAKRHLGRRPRVRGVAMNPVDHPHGGGEGKSSGGRHPVSPWGRPTKGYRTRRKLASDRLIIRRRHAAKRR